MNIKKEIFGKLSNGKQVYTFTLFNNKGMFVKISNFGATLISLIVPDRYGRFDDVVLGYNNLKGYVEGKFFFGATIGRNANRIKNAQIKINDRVYNLIKNEGKNQLHGGIKGFDKVIWMPRLYVDNIGNQCVELRYVSQDGEEGYPGRLNVKVVYILEKNNELKINYSAVSNKDTIVNLTNHSYFNLGGHDSGSILGHEIMINSEKFTVNDRYSIPTGEIKNVIGTPMDFRKSTKIGENINSNYDQIFFGKGYDNNWILNKIKGRLKKAAEVFEPDTGRVMKVYTTQPGIQFYTGNYVNENKNCKNNAAYSINSGFCLETQYFPDALNHDNFPSTILKAGELYRHTTVYRFTIK